MRSQIIKDQAVPCTLSCTLCECEANGGHTTPARNLLGVSSPSISSHWSLHAARSRVHHLRAKAAASSAAAEHECAEIKSRRSRRGARGARGDRASLACVGLAHDGDEQQAPDGGAAKGCLPLSSQLLVVCRVRGLRQRETQQLTDVGVSEHSLGHGLTVHCTRDGREELSEGLGLGEARETHPRVRGWRQRWTGTWGRGCVR